LSISVRPLGSWFSQRAVRPTMLLSRSPRFEGLVGQNDQRVVQTRRIHPNLIVADPFEHQGDFLDGWMGEV
jgi:hypothetical protein